jgi:hypothetical protein
MGNELRSGHCSAEYREGFHKHLVVYTELQFKQAQRRRWHSEQARSAVASMGLLLCISAMFEKRVQLYTTTHSTKLTSTELNTKIYTDA